MWNLYQNEKFLEPLKFSNGKSQSDVVKEVLDSIQKGHKVIFIKGVCGTGKCLEKNSLIFCKPNKENSFSYYKISNLGGQKGKIISLDAKGNLIQSNFKNVRKTGKKKLFKLKTRTGREIIVSSNHPFLTITKKGLEWLPLEKLNTKSYICLPNNISLKENVEIKEEEIKILAHLIAEGKLGDKAGSPKYYQSSHQNPKIKADYINALKNLFPDGEIKERDKEITIKFGLMNTTKGTTNKLRLLIKKYGLDEKKSSSKFVPKEIFGLENKKVAIFLSRLFSCDGSIYKRKSGQIVIDYTSISKKLIYGMSILLQRFGIQHTITSKKFKENKEYSFRISISESKNLIKYIKEIGFIGRKQKLAENLLKELKKHKFTNIDKVPKIIREYLKSLEYSYLELDRFLNYEEILKAKENKSFKEIRKNKLIKTPCVFSQGKIDFLREHIIEINKKIANKFLSFVSNQDIFWDKVKSIAYIKEDETYDLEVEKNHNFIANGIIVHNSAIALNIARKLGKTSIVVPGKNLQTQYKRDYEKEKYLLKDNKEKLKISVITGRNNHVCKFLLNEKIVIPKEKKEVNAKLLDIFDFGKKGMKKKEAKKDISADKYDLPCKIEIKEKNIRKIKEYLRQNPNIRQGLIQEINNVRRAPIAGVCPYWSPVLLEKYNLGKGFEDYPKRTYEGLKGNKFVIYQGKPGCGFYEQFNTYIDSDVLVFNSLKYILESALNRKPLTKAEIIDEGDEFLDRFSNQRKINLDWLQNSLIHIANFEDKIIKIFRELQNLIKEIKKDDETKKAISSNLIIPLKKTKIYPLLKIFLDSPEFLEDVDDENYSLDVEETAKMFEDFFEDSYVKFTKDDAGLVANIVTTNLAKRFKEMQDKNKIIILMSGTLHSETVLKNVFGLEDFVIIDAETKQQGKIDIQRTGFEIDCKYENFAKGNFTREQYLKALNRCVEISKKPALIHINSFMDLPSYDEIDKFGLQYLMCRTELKETQIEDKTGYLIDEFKQGKKECLFTTRCGRGIDFPGEQCKSIIFTKFPYPNFKDPFWEIFKRTHFQYYWDFYKDKAKRELHQKIYRGLRFKEDHIFLLSPDERVLKAMEN